MHSKTIDADNYGGPTRFHFNHDLSGEVIAVVPATAVESVPGDTRTLLVKMSGPNLEAFILEVLRDRMVEHLEQMPLDELRGFLSRR